MVAIGWHCHLAFGPRLLSATSASIRGSSAIASASITYAWSIYCIYYNIIVAVGSANSQDYVGRFEVVPGDAAEHGAARARRAEGDRAEARLPRREVARDVCPVHRAPRLHLVGRGRARGAAPDARLVRRARWLGGVVTFVIVTIDHVQAADLCAATSSGAVWFSQRPER